MNKILNDLLERESIIRRLDGDKKVMVQYLLDGHSFHSAGMKIGLPLSKIYTMREELKMDFRDIYQQYEPEFTKRNTANVNLLLEHAVNISRGNNLQQFSDFFILDYDKEASAKGWKSSAFQNTLFDIWENNPKSCTLAPREHLKTTSIIAYIIKTVYERKFPIEVNYYHLVSKIAKEKFRKMRRIIETNPLLSENFGLKDLSSDTQDYLELKDGTVITPMSYAQGTVGKHPHIIILDDVIDRKVVYSDDRNHKAIDRFYSDIYPQISKDDPEKKIIIIGTAQRNDDLYARLPADFKTSIFRAFTDKEETKPLSPDLFTVEQLKKIKADMSALHGEKYWLKEYMNQPFESLGDIIEPKWIKYYQIDQLPKDLKIVQAWDLSVGKKENEGDFTACATIGTKKIDGLLMIYVLDIYKARIKFDARLKAVVEQAKKWKPEKIGIEENVFQYDTVNTLQRQTNLPIIGIRSIKNKIEKFRVDLAPHFENGKVLIGSDMQDMVQEILSLPYGKNDDQADALTIAIKLVNVDSPEPIIDFL